MVLFVSAPVVHAPQQLISLLPLVHRLPTCSSSQPRRTAPLRAVRSAARPHDDILPLSPASFLAACKEASKEPGARGPGSVHLVGTGPGDPLLLTMKAVHLMQNADVVLYDRLVSPDILRLVHPGARMVYVGKEAGLHTRSQDEIHAMLCAFARDGATVLRLKGGDPFMFGRGGEEAEYLRARGIAVHTVPGITAASGIAAELGIPMTHRGLATSVRFLTGHSREGGEEELQQSTEALVDPHTTLVIYMGLGTLPRLAAQLQAAGLEPGTPAAAVERGTTPEQRVVYSPLEELPQRVADAKLKSPTLIIVGSVVALAPGWAEAARADAGAGAWLGRNADAERRIFASHG